MKKIILNIFSLLVLGVVVNAQEERAVVKKKYHVGVGVETDNVGFGAILDFPEIATKGILLPRVKNKNSAGTTSGTLLYDKASNKVLVYGYDKKAESNKWVELTTENSTALSGDDLNPAGKTDMSKGTVISDGTSTGEAPDGVLTLESNERALALPSVADVTQLPSPKAGLICYDEKSGTLAVFNGEKWSFWK